jgi:type II secretory pathway pseudopilin PulG
MLVALSILIILMAAVGEIFSLAGRTVRVGQATLTAMSSIRAVESQIARDVKHLDQNGFLIIRQRYYAPQWQP